MSRAWIHINSSRKFATDESNFDTKFQWILRFRQQWNMIPVHFAHGSSFHCPISSVHTHTHTYRAHALFVTTGVENRLILFACTDFNSSPILKQFPIWIFDDKMMNKYLNNQNVRLMFENLQTMWTFDRKRETYANIHSMKYAVERGIIENDNNKKSTYACLVHSICILYSLVQSSIEFYLSFVSALLIRNVNVRSKFIY